LYRLQSSAGNFLVATRSSHSPAPSTWATLFVERSRREWLPSLMWASVKVISPKPVKDQVERSSMLSSRRELRTGLLSQRNSAPSASLACMGMVGADCCAGRERAKQKMVRSAGILERRAFPAHRLHRDSRSMIGCASVRG